MVDNLDTYSNPVQILHMMLLVYMKKHHKHSKSKFGVVLLVSKSEPQKSFFVVDVLLNVHFYKNFTLVSVINLNQTKPKIL